MCFGGSFCFLAKTHKTARHSQFETQTPQSQHTRQVRPGLNNRYWFSLPWERGRLARGPREIDQIAGETPAFPGQTESVLNNQLFAIPALWSDMLWAICPSFGT